jgi:hypothetical protein
MPNSGGISSMVFDRRNGIYRSIFAALVGWLILVGNTQPVGNNTGGNSAAAQRNQDTAKNTNVAPGVSRIGDALEAQNAKSDPYEKERNEREILDLQAQEKSAYWAEAMFWATTAALILSLIGIGLVWTTFKETRKSNDIAQNHQRARVFPTAELTSTHPYSETKKVVLRCENIGLSPAYRVRCVALPVAEIPNMPPVIPTGGYERTIVVGAKDDLAEIADFQIDQYVVGMIQYDTIFSGPQQSYFCFGFAWSKQRKKWFAERRIPETWPTDT